MASTETAPSLPSQSLLPSLAITPLSSHTYTAHFPSHFCIGSVPHGGYISSIFLSVASTHFNLTLLKQNQPDTFILGLNFLRRTSAGPALFRVQDVKLGRATSVIHISLLQGNEDEGWDPRADNAEVQAVEEVVGYITNTNFSTESGISHSTGWCLRPAHIPATFTTSSPSASLLGPNWQQVTTLPFFTFRKATSHIDLWTPTPSARSSAKIPAGRVDQWVRMRSGEKWTNLHIGYLADYFPLLITFMEPKPKNSSSPGSSSSSVVGTDAAPAKFWYPTLTLNLDIKRRLPSEGCEWLNVISQMRSVRNGRSDIDLAIFDTEENLVACSSHVCLVVDVQRNTGKRRSPGERINKI